jgi:hypothetical protein
MKNILLLLIIFISTNINGQKAFIPTAKERQEIQRLATTQKNIYDVLKGFSMQSFINIQNKLGKNFEIANTSVSNFVGQKIAEDAINFALSKMPGLSYAVDLAKISFTAQQNKQQNSNNSTTNRIKDFAVNWGNQTTAMYSSMPEIIAQEIEAKYKKEGSIFLNNLDKSQKEWVNNFMNSEQIKISLINNMELTIWEQLITDIHQTLAGIDKNDGFLVLEIRTTGCKEYANDRGISPWQTNKDNCLGIASAKFVFTTNYSKQFETAINDLLNKTKKNFNDLNVPFSIKLYNHNFDNKIWYVINSHLKRKLDETKMGFGYISPNGITYLTKYNLIKSNEPYKRILQNIMLPIDGSIKKMTGLRIGYSFHEGQNLTEWYNRMSLK